MHMDNHTAGVVEENGIGVGCAVVEELRDSYGGGGGVVGLGGGKKTESYQHRAIDSASVVQKRAEVQTRPVETRYHPRRRTVL